MPRAEREWTSAARAAVLVAAAAVLSACAWFWASTQGLTGRVAAHLAVYAIAFFAYVCALAASRGLAGRWLALSLALAVAWRAALVPVPPQLSEDIYRYLWEGRVQSLGGNPYLREDRASADKWAPHRDELWRLMANKSYSAVYPPLWQLAARAVTAASHSVVAMKAFVVACELGVWAVLLLLLRRRGLPAARLLVVAWSPLALVEVAWSGHNDTFGLLFVCLALLSAPDARAQSPVVPGGASEIVGAIRGPEPPQHPDSVSRNPNGDATIRAVRLSDRAGDRSS